MKKIHWAVCAAFVLVLVYACSDSDDENQNEIPLEAETRNNVSYGSNPQQVYDLYLPANRNSNDTKIIMLIHGGAWTAGDKSDMDGTVAILQSLYPDYAIVNVNYVLADENHYAFPNQFHDIQTIVQKLTSESEELHIKPEFGMIGLSAGAHLALMYDSHFDTNDQVKFGADIVGPSDFNDPFYDESFDIPNLVQVLVDPNAYPQGTDFLTELSPVTHVNSHSSPTCMFYGNADPLVPETNGTTLQEKLNQSGVDNTLRIYNGGHGDNWSYEDMNEMIGIIGDYIEEYL